MSEREWAEEVWLCETVGTGSVAVSEREKVGRGTVGV